MPSSWVAQLLLYLGGGSSLSPAPREAQGRKGQKWGRQIRWAQEKGREGDVIKLRQREKGTKGGRGKEGRYGEKRERWQDLGGDVFRVTRGSADHLV